MPTMQEVKFKRKTTSEIDDLAIEDGSLIYNVENGKTYMDYGNERIPTGGGANGGIYVGDTEPTDPDITLWVDTPTSETKASEIVNEYTESDTVGYSTNYVNGINGKILWTNPNPTSNFGGNTITLNSSDYDMYEIIGAVSTANDRYVSTGRIPKGKLCSLMWHGAQQSSPYMSIRLRNVASITDDSITFGQAVDATNLSGNIDNAHMIPIYVIGYKTGLFS